jgi:hypothetical protein
MCIVQGGRNLVFCLAVTSAIATMTVPAAAQSDTAFHEVEAKYILGLFTLGSATRIEGEKAIELNTTAGFGKRAGRYAATETEIEVEYTPNQYVQIELGPTVSYYNIRNVPGLDDRNGGNVNGFEGDFRFLLLDRGPSPFAVTLSVEPEWHSFDETSGVRVSNYGLETKLEADTELVKNRLFLAFNTFTNQRPRLISVAAAEVPKRRGVCHRPWPSRSSRRSWSVPIFGICTTTRALASTPPRATRSIWGRLSSGRLLPSCSWPHPGRLSSPAMKWALPPRST